jgi:hypothetical protein
MSAPKHTPGPWMTDDRESSDQKRHVLDCGGHRAWLATLHLAEVYEDKSFRQEQEANAILMAASPELLRELRAAHLIIRNALAVMTVKQKAEWGRLNDLDDVVGEGITRANERAAVIAKAEGIA